VPEEHPEECKPCHTASVSHFLAFYLLYGLANFVLLMQNAVGFK
jgi:hypothetical protein